MSFILAAIAARVGVSERLVGLGAIVIAVGLLAASVAIWGSMKYREGYREGVAYMEEQNRKADEAQRKERAKTDAEIEKLDPARLCRELGGVQCDGQGD